MIFSSTLLFLKKGGKMNFKKIMLITLLLAILTMGAVSATDDVDALAVDDTGDDAVVEAPVDDVIVSDENGVEPLADDEPSLDNDHIFMGMDNITYRDARVCEISDAYIGGGNSRVSVYANESQVFEETFASDGMVHYILAKELNGTFNGFYNIKVVYTQSNGVKGYNEQLTYFDNIVGKTEPPKPGDFNVTIAKELDLDADSDKVAISWYVPATVLDGYVELDGDISGYKYLYESDAGSYMEFKLKELSFTKPGTYDIVVNYVDDDWNTLELAKGTLNVTKTYSADDFIELYKVNINSADDDIFWVHELEGKRPEGKVSIFYNGNQAFTRTYIGTSPAYITGNDLMGYFEGECTFTLVYERDADGKTYSKNLTANFLNPINNKALAPEDFNVTFPNNNVNIKDENAVIMTYFVPEGIDQYSSALRLKYGPATIDYKNIFLDSGDINKTKQVTFGELYIFDPATLNLEVLYYLGQDKILDIANSTLKVTKTYTANDFIEVYTKTLSGSTDYVCNVFDSDAGLVGQVTVLANGAQVYSKQFTNKSNTAVRINGNDLTGDLKGSYDVKVVYKRADDGKEYSKEATVTFPSSSPVIEKINSTISVDDVVVDYGKSVDVVVVTTGATGFTAEIDGKDAVVKDNAVVVSGLDVGKHILTITTTVDSDHISVDKTVTITVNAVATPKVATTVSASKVTVAYGTSKNIVVTLKDKNNVPLANQKVTVTINGKPYGGTTNANGQASIAVPKNLAVKTYKSTLTFAGDDKYENSTSNVNVVVTKAAPKLTAKAKTIKRTDKTKKYTVTLKTNLNKVMKNAKITVKVNKKTYTAKTNAKGVATFKLTKLTKKGKYSATVSFAGDKCYSAKTVKNVKITIK